MTVGASTSGLPALLGGRYRVLGSVGRGAIAEVVRARDEGTGTEVALKILYPHLRESAAVVERFLYRLTRRAEELVGKSRGASAEVDLLRRTTAAAPALLDGLGRMAARLDDLDAALEGETEGELMQTLSRLERAAGTPGADRATLAVTRRDVEAALERRHAAEQERARLSAKLCQLLGHLRVVYRQARTMDTAADQEARALEAASAELNALLAAPR